MDGDMGSLQVPSEPLFRDVYDSKARGYRYSRDSCSADTRMSCRQRKSLTFLPYIIYNTLFAFVKNSFIFLELTTNEHE